MRFVPLLVNQIGEVIGHKYTVALCHRKQTGHRANLNAAAENHASLGVLVASDMKMLDRIG